MVCRISRSQGNWNFISEVNKATDDKSHGICCRIIAFLNYEDYKENHHPSPETHSVSPDPTTVLPYTYRKRDTKIRTQEVEEFARIVKSYFSFTPFQSFRLLFSIPSCRETSQTSRSFYFCISTSRGLLSSQGREGR